MCVKINEIHLQRSLTFYAYTVYSLAVAVLRPSTLLIVNILLIFHRSVVRGGYT